MKKIILTLLFVTVVSNAQWVHLSNEMNHDVRSFVVNGNNLFVGTRNYGVYLSTNDGTNWSQTSLTNGYSCPVTANGNNIFAGTSYNYGLYKTTNNGLSWTLTPLNQQVFSLAVNGINIFAGTGYGVYLSTNNGINWTQTSLNNQGAVNTFAVNGNNIFAATSLYSNNTFLSTNNGSTWTQLSLNRKILSLTVNGNNVFAGTDSNGVYRSTDNGTSWTQTPLNNRRVLSLAISGNNIFAGTSTSYGVYVSNDNGTTWIQRNEGLSNLIIWSLFKYGNYLLAATQNNGVYKRQLDELIGIHPISTETPSQFSLSQNYPNPFNPNTKIQFALPKSSFAKLVVYDALGRELETLVREQLNAGTYEVDWSAEGEASNYPSGVYFYRLTAGNYAETKKMVLTK